MIESKRAKDIRLQILSSGGCGKPITEKEVENIPISKSLKNQLEAKEILAAHKLGIDLTY